MTVRPCAPPCSDQPYSRGQGVVVRPRPACPKARKLARIAFAIKGCAVGAEQDYGLGEGAPRLGRVLVMRPLLRVIRLRLLQHARVPALTPRPQFLTTHLPHQVF